MREFCSIEYNGMNFASGLLVEIALYVGRLLAVSRNSRKSAEQLTCRIDSRSLLH
jgi:hypothetical protein